MYGGGQRFCLEIDTVLGTEEGSPALPVSIVPSARLRAYANAHVCLRLLLNPWLNALEVTVPALPVVSQRYLFVVP